MPTKQGKGDIQMNMTQEVRFRKRVLWRYAAAGMAMCSVIWGYSPAEAMWVGQSQINPFVQVEGQYESNIFQTYSDEESDFVTIISPGVHVEYPTAEGAKMKLTADYRADIRLYGNDGDSEIDPDGELNTVDHRLGANLLFGMASGIEVEAGYALNLTSVAPSSKGDKRDPYTEHDLSASIAYRFVDIYKIELGYNGMFRGFDDAEDEVDDITDHGVSLIGLYQLSPMLAVLVGGDYGTIDRKAPFVDSKQYKAYGGFEYDVTGQTTGRLKLGLVGRKFDSDTLDDPSDFYAEGVLESKYMERSSLTVRLFREYHDTSITEETAENGVYYMSTGVEGKLSHSVASLPNLSLLAHASFSKDTYPNDADDRDDSTFEVGAGFDYSLYKFITLGAGYTYISADSNINENDYDDQLASVRIRGLL